MGLTQLAPEEAYLSVLQVSAILDFMFRVQRILNNNTLFSCVSILFEKLISHGQI